MAASVAYAVEQLERRTLLNAGDLDTTFGVGGRTQATFTGAGLEYATAVVQVGSNPASSGVFVAGYGIGYNSTSYGVVAAYGPDGSLGTGFGNGGSVAFSGAPGSRFSAVAIAPNGDIVLGGSISTSHTHTEFFVACLKFNGVLDTKFNGTGMETISFNGVDSVSAIAVQSDGKILLAGQAGPIASEVQPAFVRLTSTGGLDPTFSGDGKVNYPLTTLHNMPGTISGVTIDSTGDIFACGVVQSSPAQTAVLSLAANGNPNPAFLSGQPFLKTIGASDSPAGIAILGSALIVGGSSGGDFYAFRIGKNGSFDTSFGHGSDGPTGVYEASGAGHCVAMGVTSTNEIVLAGGDNSATAPRFTTAHLTSAGVQELVYNFSLTGSGISNFYGGVVKSNGDVDLVGQSPFTLDFNVCQVLFAGGVDRNFGHLGQVSSNLPVPISSVVQRTALQADGKFVVASKIYTTFSYDLPVIPDENAGSYGGVTYLTRYTVTGTLDTTFGAGGIIAVDGGAFFDLCGMELLPSGDIVVGGTSRASGSPRAVLQYFLPSGAPDTAFGTAGELTIAAVAAQDFSHFTALTQSPNGELFAAGWYGDNQGVAYANFVVAITSTGAVDATFGSGGLIATSSLVSYIAVDRNARVLIYADRQLTRYTSTGAIDPSFLLASGTRYLTPINAIRGLVIQPDGKFLLLGLPSATTPLERFTESGILDPTFGQNGVVNLGAQSHTINSAAILPSGNIVLAGTATSTYTDAYLAELDPTGVLVPSFATGGAETISFGEVTAITATLGEIVVRPNGKIVIAGNEANNVMAAQFTGTIPDLINATAGNDTITLTEDPDLQTVDWIMGSTKGNIPINDAAGLTINGNGGADTITLVNTIGSPFPNRVHLNGTFTINGLTGSLANTNLEIGRGPIYISYASLTADPIATLRGYLKNGYASGVWNGTPTSTTGVIGSSAAQADGTHLSGTGYADSAEGLVALPANTIELKYTLYGDTGLTGSVGFTDFMRMTQHYTQGSAATWGQGDFNYDGAVGQADFSLLQPNYGMTLPMQSIVPAVIDPAPGRPTPTVTAPPPAAPVVDSTNVSPLTLIATDTVSKKHAKPKVKHKI